MSVSISLDVFIEKYKSIYDKLNIPEKTSWVCYLMVSQISSKTYVGATNHPYITF